MPTTQVNAVGQYQACFYRVWPLGADCKIVKAGGDVGIAGQDFERRCQAAVGRQSGRHVESQ